MISASLLIEGRGERLGGQAKARPYVGGRCAREERRSGQAEACPYVRCRCVHGRWSVSGAGGVLVADHAAEDEPASRQDELYY